MESSLFTIVPALLSSLPLIMLWLAGIAMAMIRWHRHPTLSLALVVAFALMIVNAGGGAILSSLPLQWHEQGISPDEIGLRMMGIAVLRTLVAFVSWALVLVGLFSDKLRQTPRTGAS